MDVNINETCNGDLSLHLTSTLLEALENDILSTHDIIKKYEYMKYFLLRKAKNIDKICQNLVFYQNRWPFTIYNIL